MGSPTILVAGGGQLGMAVIDRLIHAGTDVTALVSTEDATGHTRELARLGARVTSGSPSAAGELLAAGLGEAAALVLTADDDSENVDAALAARRLRPDLPLVVRLFDEALGDYLRRTLTAVTVLSVSAIAAPVFADLALRALAERVAPAATGHRPRRPRRRLAMDRVVMTAIAAGIVLVTASSAYFAVELDLRFVDALYFVWTTVFTVGYGDITPVRASDTAKFVSMALMVAGAGFVAVFYALLSGWVVSRRLDVLRGRVRVRARGHVIIAGAGNVGLRVARIMAGQGYRVVVVDRDGEERNVQILAAEGHHVIIANAAMGETLQLAGIDRAAAVLALTESDATNLHIALTVRAHRPDLRVVTRLASPELSMHVAAGRDALAASSTAIASEEFARAAVASASLPG